MFQKKWFWVVFTLISLSSIFFIINYFPKVMSFINIDITMNREEAYAKTKELAAKFDWGTDEFKQVAMFGGTNGQTYIELEGGGKEAFNELLKSDFYSHYTWMVRSYKPGELLESSTYFKPTGEPYGFEVDYPEELELPNLTSDEALELAKTKAESEWGIDFTPYKLNDKKLVTTPKGRKDYTFIFERTDQQIEEAKFRLNLAITGNKFSAMFHSFKTPEAFQRRYSEMRSANNTIAGIGSILMVIFYGVLGIVVGAFFLIKTKWLIWKQALFWGIFVALLEFIASFNMLSLSWLWYQTSSSVNEHVLNYVSSSLVGFFSNVILLSVSFMVAESLTRKAFGKHTQLWKSWSPKVGNSAKTLGNTIGAYLWVPLSLTYILVFYLITTKYFGWWNSSSLGVDPNTLATSFPWLGAIAMALHAGFWEECLFRAVPIAGAILIGRKFGKEKLFFWIGMILQIIIFGMGHANYAAQPSYARVIELIFPSIVFAVVYIRFGLLAGVLIHFVFDAVLMGLPIWMVETNEMIGNKVLFVIALLFPILILVYRRFKEKKLESDLTGSNNEDWKPVIKTETAKEKVVEKKQSSKSIGRLIPILGALGIVLALLFFRVDYNSSKLQITNDEAIAKATEFIESLGVEDLDQYEVMTEARGGHRMVKSRHWYFLGEEQFKNFTDDFIRSNAISVRFAKFEGDLQDRAEEYEVTFTKDGSLFNYWHKFHEESEGASLTEEEATDLAKTHLERLHSINFNDLTLVRAMPSLKDNRTDWSFTYKDTLNYDLGDNHINYGIGFAGDELSSVYKGIKTPDKEWKKFWSNIRTRDSIHGILNITTMLLYLGSLIIIIIAWTKKQLNMKVFFILFVILILVSLIGFGLDYGNMKMGYSTSQPLGNQNLMNILTTILMGVVVSFYVSIVMAYFAKNRTSSEKLMPRFYIGAMAVGFYLLIMSLLPKITATTPDSSVMTSAIPFLGAIIASLKMFTRSLALLVPTYIILDKITDGFSKRNALTFVILLLMTASLAMNSTFIYVDSAQIVTWLILTVVMTVLVYILVTKFIAQNQLSLIWIAGFLATFKTFAMAVGDSFVGARLYNFVASIILLISVFALDRFIDRSE